VNGYTVALFFATIIIGLTYVPFYFIYLVRVRRVNQKYPLFAVRDNLVYLRIKGEFDHDPELYDYYCRMCNSLILHTQELNLNRFLQALKDVTEDDEVCSEDLFNRIIESPKPVQQTICQLYSVITKILLQNSTLLRVLVKLRLTGRLFGFLAAASEPLGSGKLLAMKEYQAVDARRQKLQLQPIV